MQRKTQHLNEIRLKAKQEKEKIDEIAFLTQLLYENKKDEFDSKISESFQRRKQIVTNTILKLKYS